MPHDPKNKIFSSSSMNIFCDSFYKKHSRKKSKSKKDAINFKDEFHFANRNLQNIDSHAAVEILESFIERFNFLKSLSKV